MGQNAEIKWFYKVNMPVQSKIATELTPDDV